MFQLHKSYTREQIHDRVGGSLVGYLPHVDGQVVCACLRTDTNPDAPDVILPGTGKDIEYSAKLLVSQGGSVPTFIKVGTKRWEYVGIFRVKRSSIDPSEIRKHAQKSNRRNITIGHIYGAGRKK